MSLSECFSVFVWGLFKAFYMCLCALGLFWGWSFFLWQKQYYGTLCVCVDDRLLWNMQLFFNEDNKKMSLTTCICSDNEANVAATQRLAVLLRLETWSTMRPESASQQPAAHSDHCVDNIQKTLSLLSLCRCGELESVDLFCFHSG